MVIVTKITGILSAMVEDTGCELASYQYNDAATANVRLDNKMPSPTALLYQITDWKLDISTGLLKEKASLNISFLQKEKKLDDGGMDQDVIIDAMKAIAIDFLQRLLADRSLVLLNNEINMKSVFLRSDSNRTGVMLELEIEERQPSCIK